MASRPPQRPRPPLRQALSLLAALALLLRLAAPLAAMPLPTTILDPLQELLAGGGICHGDLSDPASAPSKPGQLACQLCPLCAGPVPMLLHAMPVLPGPAIVPAAARGLLPPATAPPSVAFALAQPRAPPSPSS